MKMKVIRYSFITENIVFVNKANPTYKAEASRGDEFLMRHVISIVAEAVAQTKHPEGRARLSYRIGLWLKPSGYTTPM